MGRIQTRLDDATEAKLRLIAKREKKRMSFLLREIIDDYLKD